MSTANHRCTQLLCFCEGSLCFINFYVLKFSNKLLKGNNVVEAFKSMVQECPCGMLEITGSRSQSVCPVSTKTPLKIPDFGVGHFYGHFFFFYSLVESCGFYSVSRVD